MAFAATDDGVRPYYEETGSGAPRLAPETRYAAWHEDTYELRSSSWHAAKGLKGSDHTAASHLVTIKPPSLPSNLVTAVPSA